jgi:hypothetical protein
MIFCALRQALDMDVMLFGAAKNTVAEKKEVHPYAMSLSMQPYG